MGGCDGRGARSFRVTMVVVVRTLAENRVAANGSEVQGGLAVDEE